MWLKARDKRLVNTTNGSILVNSPSPDSYSLEFVSFGGEKKPITLAAEMSEGECNDVLSKIEAAIVGGLRLVEV